MFDPRVTENLRHREAILGFDDKDLGDNVLTRVRKLFRDRIVESDDVVLDVCFAEIIFLIERRRERTRTSAKLINEHTKTPYINSMVVLMLGVYHFWSEIV